MPSRWQCARTLIFTQLQHAVLLARGAADRVRASAFVHVRAVQPRWFLAAAGKAATHEIKNTMQLGSAFESFRHSASSMSQSGGVSGIGEYGFGGGSFSHASM